MKPGDRLAPFVIEAVDPGAMRAWAGFLRDPNPIHLDPAATRALGLGDRVINQGPANLAYVMNLLAENFPGMRIGSLATRFVGNLFAGERCVAGGEVREVGEEAVTCELWLETGDGRRVIEASAKMLP